MEELIKYLFEMYFTSVTRYIFEYLLSFITEQIQIASNNDCNLNTKPRSNVFFR